MPRSIPTTLLMITRRYHGGHGHKRRARKLNRLRVLRSLRGLVLAFLSQRQLAFDPREQVADVVPLQHPIAQRVSTRASAGSPSSSLPARRQLFAAAARAPRAWRRSAGRAARAARATGVRRRAARAQLADLVELLVQREHFLEQRRRHLLRGFLRRLRRRSPFELEQIFRRAPPAASACDTRRSGTTSARGSRGARPVGAL